MDGIELEILWSNLIGIVSEQAKALQRIAFSPIVREAGDLASGLFDARGRMVAQANTGTPGHINSLAAAGADAGRACSTASSSPATSSSPTIPGCRPGHFFDITVLCPIFWDEPADRLHRLDHPSHRHRRLRHRRRRARHPRRGPVDPAARSSTRPASPTRCCTTSSGSNVRTPDHVFGDLAAQVSSGRAGGERLIALCKRQGLRRHRGARPTRSSPARRRRRARRSARCRPAPGMARAASTCPAATIITLKAAVTIDNVRRRGDRSTSPAAPAPSPIGINVVMNYTHAYSTFAVRSCLNPELPNNHGSLAPIKVDGAQGLASSTPPIPSPLNARHVVGMFVPMPILKALHQVMPDRVLAEGSGAVWTVQIQGKRDDGEAFTSSMFNYSGGMGARVDQARAQRHLLSDRRRRGAGGDPRGGDADRVRPARAAAGLRRRGPLARRRRPDHRLPHAHATSPGC